MVVEPDPLIGAGRGWAWALRLRVHLHTRREGGRGAQGESVGQECLHSKAKILLTSSSLSSLSPPPSCPSPPLLCLRFRHVLPRRVVPCPVVPPSPPPHLPDRRLSLNSWKRRKRRT